MLLFNNLLKFKYSFFISLVLYSFSLNIHADVSQAPLSLTEGVAPNMIFTLDESGSMSFAYIPDDGRSLLRTRRYNSYIGNPMYYNPEVKYQIPPAFDINGKEIKLKTSFLAAPMNGFANQGENNPVVNLSSGYRPIQEHRIPNRGPSYASHPDLDFYCNRGEVKIGCSATRYSTDDQRSRGVHAYYYIYDKSCGRVTDDKCYVYQKVKENEKENYAIWYSFYKTRALATLSAASIAFYDLSSDIRFTWQDLDSCKNFNGTGSCRNNKLKPFSTTHKGQFYTWLREVSFNSSTPLPAAMQRAGEFLKKDEPWKKYLNSEGVNNNSNRYACRSSYHVLMTDGIWTTAPNPPSGFKSDQSSFKTPDGHEYHEIKPYYDRTSNVTLADFAMHYWATDLQPNLPNKIKSYIPYKNEDKNIEYWDPRNNPATWQSMSNFIMGLGLTNSLNNPNIPWEGATHAGRGYQNLLNGTSWPAAKANSDNNVYDLWHAAINSRGEFYSVDSPEAMVEAFKNILARIADRKSTIANPGISTSIESDGESDSFVSYFYTTSFDSTDGWTGTLEKHKQYRLYKADGTWEDKKEKLWSAAKEIPKNRVIKIADESSKNKLVDFTSTVKNQRLINELSKFPETGIVDNLWKERLNYLRGDQSNEGDGEKQFRVRSSILSDFLYSQPVVVNGARYLEGFSNKLESNNQYTSFISQIKNRAAMVYVGGNGGMLHGFDAKTGEEKFAFIPTAVFPYLNKLTGKKYSHQFYVDGTPTIADVYNGTEWKTILVGTLRAGGKGLFALDITNPRDIKLLWELDEFNFAAMKGAEKSSVEPGYSFSKPTVARLHNGQWAVITGNGYQGKGTENGKAALYLINAITGELIKSLEVQGDNAPNGLSTPKVADFDADGVADYAYAGDLQGNLWRFDLLGYGASTDRDKSTGSIYGDKNGSTVSFKVSNGGKPLFTAKNGNHSQPITAAPSIARHPSKKGYLIIVGTGKYFESEDKNGTSTHAQSIYGIWDKYTKAETNSLGTVERKDLQVQTIEKEVVGTGIVHGKDRESRVVSRNVVDWNSKKGWYLDLVVNNEFVGEMLVEDMRILGNVVLLSSLVPNDDPCANGSSNWLYAIDIATGGKTLHNVFETRYTADGLVQVVSGIKFGGEGGVPLHTGLDGLKLDDGNDTEAINSSDITGRKTWRLVQ